MTQKKKGAEFCLEHGSSSWTKSSELRSWKRRRWGRQKIAATAASAAAKEPGEAVVEPAIPHGDGALSRRWNRRRFQQDLHGPSCPAHDSLSGARNAL